MVLMVTAIMVAMVNVPVHGVTGVTVDYADVDVVSDGEQVLITDYNHLVSRPYSPSKTADAIYFSNNVVRVQFPK